MIVPEFRVLPNPPTRLASAGELRSWLVCGVPGSVEGLAEGTEAVAVVRSQRSTEQWLFLTRTVKSLAITDADYWNGLSERQTAKLISFVGHR